MRLNLSILPPNNARDVCISNRRKYFSYFLSLLFFIVLVLCVSALLSWHITDPSFSHASDYPTRNWLGRWGALFSDVCMQSFGLVSIATFWPLLFWAIALIRYKTLDRLFLRVFSWLLSIVSFCSFASLLSPPSNWVLSLGMGGLTGDLSIKLFSFYVPNFLGEWNHLVSLWTSLILGFTFSLIASALICKPRPFKKEFALSDYDQYDDLNPKLEEFSVSSNSNLSLLSIIGYFSHLRLAVGSFFKRLFVTKSSENQFSEQSFQTHVSESANALNEVCALNVSSEISDDPFSCLSHSSSFNLKNSSLDTRFLKKPKRKKISVLSKKKSFKLPSPDYLEKPKFLVKNQASSKETLRQNADILKTILEDFGIKGTITNARPGPVVSLYELEPAPGIKSSRVVGLSDDIARSMSAISARVAVVPGRNVIGIELPNSRREMVSLREMLERPEFKQNNAKLALALGKTIGGEPIFADLAHMPHLLVAGTTGSGKSVAINTMILSLLYRLSPDQCRLIMIDPKMLELSVYDGIPHLLTPVVTDPKKAIVALKWAVHEMEERYRKMAKVNVRNIDGFNQRVQYAQENGEKLQRTIQTGFDHKTGEAIYETEELDLTPLPYIVIIIDEMADLMIVAGKDIEAVIQRLAQMARAAGIHVVMATQRPSVDVITGTIKANFPTRISFQVTSKIDSRTILGEQGAEQLLGQGDMLFMMGGGRIQRIHGPFVGDQEVEKIVSHLKNQGIPEYLEEVTTEISDDTKNLLNESSSNPNNELYDQAVAIVLRDRKASTSYIQRRLGIGYNRAATIIERMEENGLISPANSTGKRDILVSDKNIF